MTTETWTTRDLPVLRAIVDIYEEEEDESGIEPWEIRRRTGFDEATVRKALRALNRQPYFEDAQVISSGEIWMVGAPTAEALRLVGQWPSPETLLNRLIADLQLASDNEDLPDEERGKLRRTAAFLKTSAWQLAINALGGAGGNLIAGA
ncbi:hypothetical protein EI067_30365 [Mycobacterium paragordonae]|uniref:hypothetical protein n=1 Tax=Mycobacterium paragordonae TaxID=1389713 RepID=UPI00105F26A9|nr:hypothetical protein [Mycobacterium paragordonae]TDK86065.1 hypothetical protein EI067_30365 [Mycobacterium paragordonae]